MGKKKEKPRVIPEQDGRIIGAICMCQLTMVLSGVALVYLSVAVYAPSHRAFNSGFYPTPVMCETVNMSMVSNCPWASCGEWCLTRPSGYCAQVMVTVRRHGSNLTLSGCTKSQQVSCPPTKVEDLAKINCHKTECNHMRGLFSCSKGHCANISEVLQCMNHGEGAQTDVLKDTGKLTGNYECSGSRCSKIKRQLECEYICPMIMTGQNNVFLSKGDVVVGAQCSRASASDPSVPGPEPAPFWQPTPDGALFVSCYTFNNTGDTITATDCVNGTMISPLLLPQPSMNYTQIRTIWRDAMESDSNGRPRSNVIPRGGALLPPSHLLSLHEGRSRLYINLKGCVNTLRGECREFFENYGSDGRNFTARSRFPCFYNKNDSFLVLARFDLEETWRELIVAVLVPAILFVISLTTLCIITRSVKVGDDAKLRCLSCCSSSSSRNTQETATTTT